MSFEIRLLFPYCKIVSCVKGELQFKEENLAKIISHNTLPSWANYPIGALAVIGPPSSGKSFITNLSIQYLTGRDKKISSGFYYDSVEEQPTLFKPSDVDMETSGVYLWPVPFPIQGAEGKTVLLWIFHLLPAKNESKDGIDKLGMFLVLAASRLVEITLDKKKCEVLQWKGHFKNKFSTCESILYICRSTDTTKLFQGIKSKGGSSFYSNSGSIDILNVKECPDGLHDKNGQLNLTENKTLDLLRKTILDKLHPIRNQKSEYFINDFVSHVKSCVGAINLYSNSQISASQGEGQSLRKDINQKSLLKSRTQEDARRAIAFINRIFNSETENFVKADMNLSNINRLDSLLKQIYSHASEQCRITEHFQKEEWSKIVNKNCVEIHNKYLIIPLVNFCREMERQFKANICFEPNKLEEIYNKEINEALKLAKTYPETRLLFEMSSEKLRSIIFAENQLILENEETLEKVAGVHFLEFYKQEMSLLLGDGVYRSDDLRITHEKIREKIFSVVRDLFGEKVNLEKVEYMLDSLFSSYLLKNEEKVLHLRTMTKKIKHEANLTYNKSLDKVPQQSNGALETTSLEMKQEGSVSLNEPETQSKPILTNDKKSELIELCERMSDRLENGLLKIRSSALRDQIRRKIQLALEFAHHENCSEEEIQSQIKGLEKLYEKFDTKNYTY